MFAFEFIWLTYLTLLQYIPVVILHDMPSYVKALLVASAGLLAPSATHAAQEPCPEFTQFANGSLKYADCVEEMTKELTQLAMLVPKVQEAKLEGKDL